jgi:hypothetical protein
MLKYLPRPTTATLLSILVLFLFTSCVKFSIYQAVDVNQYSGTKRTEKKYIVLDPAQFSSPLNIPKIVKSLSSRTFENKALSFNLPKKERDFLIAIERIIKADYEGASNVLNTLPDHSFDWQVAVLKADCMHQLKQLGDGREHYQIIYDSAQSALVKELVKNRYRYYQNGL